MLNPEESFFFYKIASSVSHKRSCYELVKISYLDTGAVIKTVL